MGASEDDLEICLLCNAELRQDEDVLDTWVSSQLWPLATQGWPNCPDFELELATYYPTQVLSTARDIIFLWVARMVLSSLYCVDQIPFCDVLIHPTVLDRFGNIMSKSRGNGIDPVNLINDYGADGMRFGLALQVTGNQDLKFNEDKLLGSRNFATKIWNASRFVLMQLDEEARKQFALPLVSNNNLDQKSLIKEDRTEPSLCPQNASTSIYLAAQPVTEADRWILSRLALLAEALDDPVTTYDFGARARLIQKFFWNEFCDWYIEISKSQMEDNGLKNSTAANLVFVLDKALRLLHPYMPFITEKIWQSLPHGSDRPSLMVAQMPRFAELSEYVDVQSEQNLELLISVVGTVRSARSRYNISPRQALSVVVRTSGENARQTADILTSMQAMILRLGTLENLVVQPGAEKPANASVTVEGELEIFVELQGLVDFAAENERLAKEQSKLTDDLTKLEKKLANEGFLAKAAPEIIQKTRNDAAEVADALSRIVAQLNALPKE
jgi:valyl-tRNA synthetase